MKDRKNILFALWVFVTLNYLYCDVLSLMDPATLGQLIQGDLGFVKITPQFLLAGSVLMEIPMAMTILSMTLKYRVNRWANIIAGTIKTFVQISSLFMGTPAIYYLFFSVVEIAATSFIIWYAWSWRDTKPQG